MTAHRLVRMLEADGILIDRCDCGEVHLHVDRTTVHLREGDVMRILEGLRLALGHHRAIRAQAMAKA